MGELLDITTKFVVLIPFYNAEKTIYRAIESVVSQISNDWTIVLLDDASKDDSKKEIDRAIEEFGLVVDKNLFYRRNDENVDIMQNVLKGMHMIPDECIVGICDGDDFLHMNAVSVMLDHYEKYDLEFAWSNFIIYPSLQRGWSREVNPDVSPRVFHPFFWMSHFRTWKAGLFKQIPIENFKDNKGNFYGPANDVAIMFSLWDLTDKYMYVDDYLYYYNVGDTENTTRAGEKRRKQLLEEFDIRTQLSDEQKLIAQNYYKHVIIFFEAAMSAAENDEDFANILRSKGLMK